MEDSSLRDNLDDVQAEQLLDWGLGQVKASAAATAALPKEEAEKKMEKDGEISQDEQRAWADEIQQLTDDTIKQIDESVETKEAEILQV